ncbi:MAG: hypothetical protein K9L83_08345 [Deltaproteobacteria bacterium]|nr:hypothetical protein [Deltaproteobacteria bacterium]
MDNPDKIKQRWVDALLKANQENRPISSLCAAFGELGMDAAYEVQERVAKFFFVEPGDVIHVSFVSLGRIHFAVGA